MAKKPYNKGGIISFYFYFFNLCSLGAMKLSNLVRGAPRNSGRFGLENILAFQTGRVLVNFGVIAGFPLFFKIPSP